MRSDEGRRRAVIVPVLVFLAMMVALSSAWWAVDRQWRRNVDRQLELASTQASRRLQGFIQSRLLAISSIADYLAGDDENVDEEFVNRTRILQKNFGGFQALNWVGADGTIEVVVPLEPNKEALGKNVLEHPVARETFERARDSRGPRMTAPVDLFQGGRGVATYLPVLRSDAIWGYLNAVFRIAAIVEASLGADMLDSHGLRIVDGGNVVDGNEVVYESDGVASYEGRPSGVSSAAILDREWTLIAYPDDELWATMQAGRPRWIFVLAGLLAAGACWLLHGALLRNWQQATERREREQLGLQLERSAKMQALGRLAGGVAHDFNNILTAIIGNAEIIKLTSDVPITQQASEDIVLASERAGDLTRQLLVFSNQRPEVTGPVDLNEEVEALRSMLSRLLSENIVMDLELGKGIEPVACNRGQISQIIVNLAVNAADAMPSGGQLRISTRNEESAAGSGITTSIEGPCVVLSVVDTGDGMDEETRSRIFEPFYSTKGEDRDGAGLGLATVYGIVTGLGGEVRVESAVGEGSCFEIWLPGLVGATGSENDKLDASAGAGAGPARRILFVEDNDSVRNAIATMLRQYGHAVVAAVDGKEALRMIESLGADEFDIVVTDAVMPGMSGPELIRSLRAKDVLLPIVLCSGYSEELSEIDTLSAVGTRFIPKPYSIARLLETIDEETGGHHADARASKSR